MQRFQSITNFLAAFSQLSHIFCCGLPAVFSGLSLLAGLGVLVSMPSGLEQLHYAVHDYEMPLITMAGVITALGWVLHAVASRIDCRSTGCAHAPCAPKKKRSSKVLVFSTVLFVINILIILTAHGSH